MILEAMILEDEEVECVDCGCAVIADPDRRIRGEPAASRCDTDEAHHFQTCGEDCPVICDVCKEHHFGKCVPRSER
jgi:hypothetical protein